MNRSRRTNTLVFTREQHVNRLRLPDGVMLMPERGDAWTNRMEVLSSSGKRYVIAQHREKRHWGCDCRGYKTHRTCHHLRDLGLPTMETPYEVAIEGAGLAPIATTISTNETAVPGITGTNAGREIAGLDEV